MMLRFLFALFAVLLAASPASAQPRVSDVRVGVHGSMTRFVIELSEAPRYRVFTLPDPFRVVLD
ncbi:MAG: N-acetylmuramoyl-L-alanine amidase, partial [Geminicoccales bacterium]